MAPLRTPSQDHAQFDAICERVGDWDPLPTVTPEPAQPAQAGAELDHEQQTEPLDRLILAGLVSPY